jgi:HTH-type transcriptional regulator / antitoxin HipB
MNASIKSPKLKLRELEWELAAIGAENSNLHPRQVIGWTNSYNLTIRKLKEDIEEYEQFKSGKVRNFPIDSLQDLPLVMIKARIAVGMTQKELAEKIGVQEQQIQRYEANNYRTVGFDRLQEVMSALDVTVSKAVIANRLKTPRL